VVESKAFMEPSSAGPSPQRGGPAAASYEAQ
jgi:hypothetical protein